MIPIEIKAVLWMAGILTGASLVSRVLDWIERVKRIRQMKTAEDWIKEMVG